MPHPYPRVLALARSVTAHDTTTYDKVQSLIHWIGAHTHYSENIPPLPAGRRHRRRVPLRQPGRLLRADLDLAGGDAALARHSRPRGGGVRAGGLRPDHRPVPGPRQRRPCLGPGVVPRLRLAGLRPDGGRAAHRPSPGVDRAARRRLGSAAASLRCRSSLVAGGRRPGRRRRALAPGPAGDVGGAGGAPCRARRAPGRPAPPAGRDPGRVRRSGSTSSAGTGTPTWSRLASSVEASAYGGARPAPRRAARHGRRPGGPGSARAPRSRRPTPLARR